jgi:phage-related baseplate assembly protein
MTTLDVLLEPMTVDEAREAIYEALTARGVNTTSWKSGAVVRSMVAGFAVVLSAVSQMQAQIAKLGFLEFSEAEWLTLVARYVYGVERDLGSFAAGTLTFDNASGAVYSGNPGDLIVSSSVTGKEYRNTESYTIGALATGVEIAFEAVEIGNDSSAGAGDVDTMVTSLTGVTVTNATAIIGTDPEDDATLRLRCREKLGALSPNGPADAYAYFARGARTDDGTSAGVTRVRVIPDGAGNVSVYVATASGAVTGTLGDTSTALGAVDDAIQRNVVPLCVTANVTSVSTVAVPVTYEIWVRSTIGLTDEQVEEAVQTALEAFFSTHPIGGEVIPPAGGYLYVDALRAAIADALPARSVVRLTITLPAADVALDEDEVATLGALTCTAVHTVTGEVV